MTGNSRHWLDYSAVVVAVFAALASWYQFQASREQLQAMKLDQRPWISLELKPEGPLTRNENNGLAYTFKYALANVGRSPAFNVVFTATMLPLGPAQSDAPPAQGSFAPPVEKLREAVAYTCGENQAAQARGDGAVMFPSDHRDLRWRAHSPGPTKGYVPGFAVVACVSYQYTGDSAVHRTVRVFELTHRDYGKMIQLDAGRDSGQEVEFFARQTEGFIAD